MPTIYPAMKLKMGTWDYYLCKISMQDLANEINFAHDVSGDFTINEAIQRELNDSRAKKQIVKFLQVQDERFFNSLVVAALGGNPKFSPIKVEDERFGIIADQMSDTFGILTFDANTQKLFALDGQHRLKAIKELILGDETCPPGFAKETISVAFVIPNPDTPLSEFRKSYRRLFSNLNRHAKPTDKLTNIIMDEDDRFAILTRRLVSDCLFFQWNGEEGVPKKIDTTLKSDNIMATNTSFAGLINLYKMNVRLLWDATVQDEFGNLTFAPSNPIYQAQVDDNHLEELYDYLERIWDALLMTLPDLAKDPVKMRVHSFLEMLNDDSAADEDSLLFWPIGQVDLMARLARRLMDERGITISSSSTKDILDALKPLSKIPWSMRHELWKYFLLIPSAPTNPEADNRWKMIITNEQASQRVNFGYQILLWLTGIETLSQSRLEETEIQWAQYLMTGPDQTPDSTSVFENLVEIRDEILSE